MTETLRLPDEPELVLAFETSNPRSGPRGPLTRREITTQCGPGVALGILEHSEPPGVLSTRAAEMWPRVQAKELDVELLDATATVADDLEAATQRLLLRNGVTASQVKRLAISIGPGDAAALEATVAFVKRLASSTGAVVVTSPSAKCAGYNMYFSLAPAIVCLAGVDFAHSGAVDAPIDREGAHGTLLPPKLKESSWWQEAGREAVRDIVDAETFEAFAAKYSEGFAWLWTCELGFIGADDIVRLRPRSLVADHTLPSSMATAANAVGAQIVEPIFSASSVLARSAKAEVVAVDALMPADPWRRMNRPT